MWLKKRIDLFFWFMVESKRFTEKGYLELIFKEDMFRRGFSFVKQSIYDEKMIKEHGENYYLMMDRTIEM